MNAIRDKIITAEQFLAMEKDEHAKYELIDGTICMSPSPTFEHQKIASRFVVELAIFLLTMVVQSFMSWTFVQKKMYFVRM